MIEICEQRQRILDCDGHALVIGGAGSGKTTIALKKAVRRIEEGLTAGQLVLFLSFSRAAVARLAEAATLEASKRDRSLLSMQTFHSFFWELIKTHAYLLGSPRRLQILLPQDEKALCGGIDESDSHWAAWVQERERLFKEEGKIAFDLFAAEMLGRSRQILRLVAQRYPLIVVDEAQDTGQHAWRCIELLAPHAQVICLAVMEQQIFDYLPGVGPERIAVIRQALKPLEIDLGSQNHRSPGTEILAFGNDILTGRIRGAPYKGVSELTYNPKTHTWNVTLRRALAVLHRHIPAAAGEERFDVAILLPNNKAALRISNALNALDGEGKAVTHKLLFDEAEAMLSARFAAFLLEPKKPGETLADVAQCYELMAAAKRATGQGRAQVQSIMAHAAAIRAGRPPRANLYKALSSIVETLQGLQFTGDPAKDWLLVKRLLRETQQTQLVKVCTHLDYLVAFKRGQRISAYLSAEWLRDGRYTKARAALDNALAQDQLLDGMEAPAGLQVMTFHKAKGKQFDGVIIVREGRPTDDGKFVSNFLWWDDEPPYTKSRRVLRVGVTRAKAHTLILNPHWPSCPILRGHIL